MSTNAQIQANQKNAQNSTGPRTEAGKAASSQNNLKFGFCGKFIVLSLESQEEFDVFLDSLREEHQPATVTEAMLVQKMAEHFWLSRRAQHLQSMSLGHDIPYQQQCQEFALYLRYQTTHDRAFHKSLDQLLKLRTERRKAEIGFESQKHQAADETRKQEAHEAKVRLATAKAKQQELETDVQETMQFPFPGNTTIPFSALKPVQQEALTQVAKDPALQAALKAA